MDEVIFLKNIWYVAGWSRDLAPGSRIARTVLDQPVVLWRSEGGDAFALHDRCAHRAMPLSAGVVDGESIRCPYHGLEFGGDGRCTRIPAQDRVPDSARVQSYPLVEKQGMLWIWMGDAERASTALIPDYPIHEDVSYAWRSAHFHVNGNWQLLVDNLMDLSHLPYIHAKTIGGNPELHFKTKTHSEKLPNGVRVVRHMPDSVPPPTYVDAAGFKGRIDRWQEIEFEPTIIRIHTGACDVGTGAYDGARMHGFSMRGFHGITPETATTTHYFWSMATNILRDDIPDEVFEQTARTFREDQEVLELQQLRISADPDRAMIDIASDVGGRHTRQFIARLLREETRGSVEVAT
ncbi:aromatic ring-hydroxylating dioxygenase subunit alpha (plasmid) [Novosphingobium resinovorum]|uniref:aromatic ring-hydroxylating dioxygenase subunit alpha n=1 Tax=Novosphingobium TaxID=165696 RepID=UPI001B3C6485|nr:MULTISPECIES: aromatic ring-hydroxylating dioxygenase subunit alpha [Novosphingobium]MBF7015307.1 aromatic ring-hydroxylating dioxygenase subunit alpha [Novosphingobium sp. HR1a]WJM29986.1 aromatic ring-hydroxylating dioxygenase subunit alpha [Novosphingobium resinovorum]